MAVWSLLLQDDSEGPTFIFCTAHALQRFLTQAVRFIFGAAPIDYGPVLLLMPFGFHLAMDTLPSAVPNPRCGQRVVTPAFGYGSPHLGARGTSTLLNNALLSAHYEPSRSPL